jgi:DNA-binding CsgD family transcriptional regulator
MNRLSHREFDRLSSFLLDLYAFRDHDTFVKHILTALHDLIPCEHVSYNEMDIQGQHGFNNSYPDNPRISRMTPLFGKLMHQHPVVQHLLHDGRNEKEALKLSDFVTQRELQRLELYQEYYRKVGTTHQVVVNVDRTDQVLIPFVLNRHRVDFTEHERLYLTLLRPHLAQAYRNARSISRLSHQIASLDTAMTTTGLAAVRVNDRGIIQWASAKAPECLHSYCRMSSAAQLPTVVSAWFLAQAAHTTSSQEHLSSGAPLVLENDTGRLVIHLLKDRESWCLLLHEFPTVRDEAALERAGLTKRESEVLRWIMDGKTNEDVATILCMKPGTVKKHLERIYVKLGVENRTGAATKALELTWTATLKRKPVRSRMHPSNGN